MTTGTVAPLETQSDRLKTLTESFARPDVARAISQVCPPGMDPTRIVRIALNQIEEVDGLAECWGPSILGSVIECATLGLLPGATLQQAWILPFYNGKTKRKEAQLIPGYRGLSQLAYEHPKVCGVRSGVVYAEDTFEEDHGSGVLVHRPHRPGDHSQDPVAYYGVIDIAAENAISRTFEVMSFDEVCAVRDGIKYWEKSKLWTVHFHAAGRKSALRRALKLAPMTERTQRAVALDEQAEANEPQQFEREIDVTPPAEPERDPDTGEEIPEGVGRE